MKKIRRTRITIKTRELLIVKNGVNVFDGGEQNVCPVCNAPIIEQNPLKINSVVRLLEENKSAAELPNTKILSAKKI